MRYLRNHLTGREAAERQFDFHLYRRVPLLRKKKRNVAYVNVTHHQSVPAFGRIVWILFLFGWMWWTMTYLFFLTTTVFSPTKGIPIHVDSAQITPADAMSVLEGEPLIDAFAMFAGHVGWIIPIIPAG